MERTISQRELRNDNAKIVRALETGDTFVVTRNGVPIARLVPYERRVSVPTKELLESAAHLGDIDFARFRADIDALVDQDPTPRA
jgi:prevent-host-death family protein